MSDASTTAPSNAPASAGARQHRSAKNYLLDRHFQLKYAGFLVGVTLLVSSVLGAAIWSTGREVIEQSARAVEQGRLTVEKGQETVRRGQQVLVETQKVSKVVAMYIAREYKDDADLAKTFGDEAADTEAKLLQEQKQLEDDARRLQAQAAELELQAAAVARQQRSILIGLVAGLGILVVCIGLAGIVFTHKVAGPIYKMKRLLRQVGEGRLVLRERLRKGDELQDFFGAFEKMVDDLRARQRAEIAQLDEILVRLDAAPTSRDGRREVDEAGIALLKKLRQDMQAQIEA